MPRYDRVERITRAGQGTVWAAVDQESGQLVAIKTLNENRAAGVDDVAVRRFRREVRSQSQLDHPGIMPVLAHDFDASPPWYAMPLAECSLDVLLAAGSPLSVPDLAEVALALLAAVDFAHQCGVLHRDLKPANLLRLVRDDAPCWVVADFGLCRDTRSDSAVITRTSAVLGTERYMAPEQFDDAHNVGPTADVYAIGCLLFHCLTGRPPGMRHVDLDDVPAPMRPVIGKATEGRRDRRYASVAALRSDFTTALARLQERDDVWSTASLGDLHARLGLWLGSWCESSIRLHDLTADRLRDLVSAILMLRGYTLLADTEEQNSLFGVRHAREGRGVVQVRVDRFNVSSDTLRRLMSEVVRSTADFDLLVTTGTLSPQAADIVDRDPRLRVIDGRDVLDDVPLVLLAQESLQREPSG